MTSIFAIQGETFAAIGSDSRWMDSAGRVGKQIKPKVFTVGRYLIGVAGDTRGINILQYVMSPPLLPPKLKGVKLDKFMVSQFIPVYRTILEVHGLGRVPYDDKPAETSIETLVLANGTIYAIDCDYGTEMDSSGIYAIGSGTPYGVAALEALCAKKKMTPHLAKQAILKALAISVKYDSMSGAPFHTFIQQTNN